VLVNLVSNAVKFTDEGAVTVTVEPGPSYNDRIAIRVEDTGVGIPEDEQDHVFDAFRRGEGAHGGGSAGRGLGLAIADRTVDRMRGTLEVESAPGEGTYLHRPRAAGAGRQGVLGRLSAPSEQARAPARPPPPKWPSASASNVRCRVQGSLRGPPGLSCS